MKTKKKQTTGESLQDNYIVVRVESLGSIEVGSNSEPLEKLYEMIYTLKDDFFNSQSKDKPRPDYT